MKKFLFTLLALPFIIGCNSTTTTNPNNGTVKTNVGWSVASGSLGVYDAPKQFAANGSNVFILSEYAIFYSPDNGATITERDAGLLFDAGVQTIFASNNYVFVITSHGVFRSSDNGLTWPTIQKSTGPLRTGIAAQIIAFHNALYLTSTSTDTCVWRSTDGGDTWVISNNGLPSVSGATLIPVGNSLFVQPYASPSFYVSTDDGSTWSKYSGATATLLNTDPTTYSAFSTAVVTANGTVLIGRKAYSPDTLSLWGAPSGSDNFTPRMNGMGIKAVYQMSVSGNNIFAAGTGQGGGIYYSTDNGDSWTNITPSAPVGGSYSSVAALDGYLYAGCSGAGNMGELVRRPLTDFN